MDLEIWSGGFPDLDILQKCGEEFGERPWLIDWESRGTLRSRAGPWEGSRGQSPRKLRRSRIF